MPYSRKKPFPARMLVNRKLTLEGSEKDTRHFELSLAGSGYIYECGDSLGVFPTNCPDLVEDIIRALHATGDEIVPGNDGAPKPLRAAFSMGTFPAVIKEAMQIAGLPGGMCRRPVGGLSEEEREQLRRIVTETLARRAKSPA